MMVEAFSKETMRIFSVAGVSVRCPQSPLTCGRCIWCSSCLKTNGLHMRLCKNEQVEHKSYYNIVKPSKEACRLWKPSLRDITEDEKDSSLFDDFGTIPTPRK